MQNSGRSVGDGEGGNCEQSFSTTWEIGGPFVLTGSDTVGVSDTGPAANLVCSRLLERRNHILQRTGFPRVPTCPDLSQFQLADERLGKYATYQPSQSV